MSTLFPLLATSPPASPAPLPSPRLCNSIAATESSVLASLWLLEAMQDAERSSATAALTDYLACLGAFSPVVRALCCAVLCWRWLGGRDAGQGNQPAGQGNQPAWRGWCWRMGTSRGRVRENCPLLSPALPRAPCGPMEPALALRLPAPTLPPLRLPQAVATLSLDWPASFCRMRAGLVATQADLLRRLDWRLRLNFGAGAWHGSGCWSTNEMAAPPCTHHLFPLKPAPLQMCSRATRCCSRRSPWAHGRPPAARPPARTAPAGSSAGRQRCGACSTAFAARCAVGWGMPKGSWGQRELAGKQAPRSRHSALSHTPPAAAPSLLPEGASAAEWRAAAGQRAARAAAA